MSACIFIRNKSEEAYPLLIKTITQISFVQNPCAKLCYNLVLSLMCITELHCRGAYTRQSAEIKPNSEALPLPWLSHEAKGYILLATQPEPGVPSHLRQSGWHTALQPPQPGWHTALQPRRCALFGECRRLLAAVLTLGWNSTTNKGAGGSGLP